MEFQIWKVVPSSTPKMIRKCTRCHSNRFSSSDKFRINANKKIIDVWLIYKCTECDFTVNRTIISRKNVSCIDRTLLARLLENDIELARHYAFDTNFLQGVKLDWNIDFLFEFDTKCRVLKEEITFKQDAHKTRVLITCEYFLKIPIFSVLRKKMEHSRNQLEKLYEKGDLTLYNLQGDNLDLKTFMGKHCVITLC